MTYGELVNNLRYLAKVYSICEQENMREYSLSIAAADAIENLDDICQHQADEIRELKNQWVSVEERLPEKPEGYPKCEIRRTYYLVALKSGCVKALGYDFDMDEWQITGSPVVAWMPLPEPPKDGE